MLTLPQGLLLGGYSSFSIKWCPRVWFHHVLSSTSRKAPVPGVRQCNSHSSFQVLSSVTFQPPCFVRKAWNLETKKTQVPKKGQKKIISYTLNRVWNLTKTVLSSLLSKKLVSYAVSASTFWSFFFDLHVPDSALSQSSKTVFLHEFRGWNWEKKLQWFTSSWVHH